MRRSRSFTKHGGKNPALVLKAIGQQIHKQRGPGSSSVSLSRIFTPFTKFVYAYINH